MDEEMRKMVEKMGKMVEEMGKRKWLFVCFEEKYG